MVVNCNVVGGFGIRNNLGFGDNCNNVDFTVNSNLFTKGCIFPFNSVGVILLLGILFVEYLVSSGIPLSFIECNFCACFNIFEHGNGYFELIFAVFSVRYNQVNVVIFLFGHFGVNGSIRIVDFFINGRLYNDVPSGHFVNGLFGFDIYPTLGAFILGVIQHLGEVGAYGKESIENNFTVIILEGYTEEVVYLNGNIKAGGHVSGLIHNHVQSSLEQFGNLILASFYSGYARTNCAQYLIECLFYKCSCIKGNGLCKYKCGVACVEVHQAVVSDLVANSGVEETVCNADSIALYKVVNATCVFCLVNCNLVEVCERILGSRCCLEQVFHIELVTNNFCEFFDNIVSGVVEVVFNLVGQKCKDREIGSVFESYYKFFEGRNGFECFYEILCLEIVGKIITGNSIDISKENLCITRSEHLVVCLAEECGINCFENSNDLFESQVLCECDEVIGLCCVSCENLILNSIDCGVRRICHLFESNAENACKLGRNLNLCYELAIGEGNVANLIEQNRKLCCCCTNLCGACSENKVEVDFLGLFNLTVKVGDCKACGEQLTAIIKVCKLVERRNKIFESIDQSCRLELQEVFFVLGCNSNTVKLNFGNGLLNFSNNTECLDHIVFNVNLIEKFFSNVNTGCVNNLNELLNVNLFNECANVDSLNQAFCINHLGDNAIAENALSDSNNIEAFNKLLVVGDGYVANKGLIAADCVNNCINTDYVNDSSIIGSCATLRLCETIENLLGHIGSTFNLANNDSGINQACITLGCKGLVCNQLVNVNSALLINSILGNQGRKRQQGFLFAGAKEDERNINSCNLAVNNVTVE